MSANTTVAITVNVRMPPSSWKINNAVKPAKQGTHVASSTVAEMSKNQTGSVKVRLQPSADPLRSKPYPLGAGEDVWGLGFQIAAPKSPNPSMRSPGSLSWAGINNTFYWIDPRKQVGAVILMQMLPFYDEAAIRTLQGFEERVYKNLN